MADRQSLLDTNHDVNTVFITKTVQEIKQTERKTRLDIERKKEELRQLVGERYHDMIEAADSVIKMKEYAQNVTDTLTNVRERCLAIQQTHLLKGTGGQQAPPTLTPTQCTSAQMRLIVDMQGKIWSHLEGGDHLSATICYLIMRNGSSRMRILESIKWPAIMEQLARNTEPYRISIVESCRAWLRTPGLSARDHQSVVKVLISLLLLERCEGVEDILNWFLLDRKVAMETVLAAEVQSVRACVRGVFEILRNTLFLIRHLFVPMERENGDCQIVVEMRKITRDFCLNYIPADLVARLPDYIINYCPTITITNVPLTLVHKAVQDWLNSCSGEACTPSLRLALVHVTSLKSLVAIRDSVYTLLSHQVCHDDGREDGLVSARMEWREMCQVVVRGELSLYSVFLQPLLLEQAKNVLETQLKEFQSSITDLLSQLLTRFQSNREDFQRDSDLSLALWHEGENENWAESEGMLLSLRMQAQGCTPQINIFCGMLNSKLQKIVEDLNWFLSQRHTEDDSNFPFNEGADIPPLMKVLKHLVTGTITGFVDEVDRVATETSIRLDNSQGNNDTVQVSLFQDRLLLLVRLCHCFTDFTPNLRYLIDIPDGSPWKQSSANKAQYPNKGLRKADINGALLDKENDILNIWCKHLSLSYQKLFGQYLRSENDTTSLCSSVAWEEITVLEETQSGERVSSQICLPSQASVYIGTMLFAVCQEITRIGGHCVSELILKDLVHRIFGAITDLYLEFCEQMGHSQHSISQPLALQLLFDYKLLSFILWYPQNDQVASKHSRLIDLLVSFIDPFDYDVFSPHLSKLLDRQLQRSTVMYGVLFGLKGRPSLSSELPTQVTTSREPHIILPLSSNLPRIPLLPGSSTQTSSFKILESGRFSSLKKNISPNFFSIATSLQHV